MFGRRREKESAQEAERKALFAELAKRPDTVCPFLGLAEARTDYRGDVTDEHRCYAFGDPAEISAEQQTKVCLQRGYGNCPRYLRGVLVIPTEELEALRHPQAAAEPAPPPPASAGRGRRVGLLVGALVLVLAVGGGLAAFLLMQNNPVAVASPTPLVTPTPAPTPSPAPSDSGPSATPEPTQGSTQEPTPSPTPVVLPSGGALPTPGPDDTPTGYAVRVQAGTIAVVEMEHDGTIDGSAVNSFDHESWAPVERIEVNGTLYWRTLQGGYTGRAYSRSLSSAFDIFETYDSPSGDPRFRLLNEDEY